ncbi:MAG: hypothetical protein CMJ58_24425 [Planctomycetaceae bacterium]|nr:hypothetical protein [Planctomycetaceae bacterium]
MAQRPWAIIGNPENRRVAGFQHALKSRGLAPAVVLSYEDLLADSTALQSLPRSAIVRVESPGENLAVEHLLVQAGESAAKRENSCIYAGQTLSQLPRDHGRIIAPRQWYLGYVTSMRDWAATCSESSEQLWTTTADALALQFDKPLCQTRCRQAGIPTPTPLGVISGFDELCQKMSDQGIERVFVKLANSSSASGVVALHRRRGEVSATTSVEVVQGARAVEMYNSLKIKRYTSTEEVQQLIDALAAHRACAEQWLPKASLSGRVCDLRLLVIAGEPRHTVVRTSRSPLTNLHLGNRRGDIEEFWRRIPEEQQRQLWETCRRCARLFPESLHLGLDVLFTPGFRSHYLLEINAFGDLLPNVVHRGVNAYEAEVEAVLGGWSPASPTKRIA